MEQILITFTLAIFATALLCGLTNVSSRIATAVFALFLALILCNVTVIALPGGATISSSSTSGAPTTTPSNRSDARGTITTIVMNAVTQDSSWKAYVGNITGKLSLADAADNVIYDWALTVGKVGKVFISRSPSPDWTGVACINGTNLAAEQSFFSMVGTQNDNIARTFNYTTHQAFSVGSVPIAANTCNSTATYLNSTRQSMGSSIFFSEVLLQDNVSNVIYTTMINASTSGFNNQQYDFQAIVPENVSGAPTLYYFYTELG